MLPPQQNFICWGGEVMITYNFIQLQYGISNNVISYIGDSSFIGCYISYRLAKKNKHFATQFYQ